MYNFTDKRYGCHTLAIIFNSLLLRYYKQIMSQTSSDSSLDPSYKIKVFIRTLSTRTPYTYYELHHREKTHVSQICNNLGMWNEVVTLKVSNFPLLICFHNHEGLIGLISINLSACIQDVYSKSDFIWLKLNVCDLKFEMKIGYDELENLVSQQNQEQQPNEFKAGRRSSLEKGIKKIKKKLFNKS
jgi:hypothetical protein